MASIVGGSVCRAELCGWLGPLWGAAAPGTIWSFTRASLKLNPESSDRRGVHPHQSHYDTLVELARNPSVPIGVRVRVGVRASGLGLRT